MNELASFGVTASTCGQVLQNKGVTASVLFGTTPAIGVNETREGMT